MRVSDSRKLTTLSLGLCVIVGLAAVGCGQSSPTGPTPTGSIAARGLTDVAGATNASSVSAAARGVAAAIVEWECFAGGLSRSCPAPRASVLGVTTGEIVTAAPANLTRTVQGTTVLLSWGVPPGSQPTSYVIEAGSTSGASNITTFNTGNAATSLTVNNVPPGTYFVRVRGRDAAGNGPASNEVTVVVGGTGPGPAPAGCTPRNLTAIVLGSEVSLAWDEPSTSHTICGRDRYLVEVGSAPGASNLAQVSTPGLIGNYAVSGAPLGTYYIRVRAQGPGGLSSPSSEVVVTVTGISPPGTTTWTGLVANGDGGTFTDTDEEDENCGTIRTDITATIVQSGTTVTGIMRTTIRSATATDCVGLVGFSFSEPFVGTVTGQFPNGSGTFSLRTTGANDDEYTTVNGSFANGRMTGTFTAVESDSTSTGTFAINRQ